MLYHALSQVLDNDTVFREEFENELMCMMHFQILVLLSAETRLQREVSARVTHAPRYMPRPCSPLSNFVIILLLATQ